ncbi:hypothetical protein MYAER_1165 [Microcystis aeruginosa NIES-2549]|uniref:Uncharacterized protein n=1 Tax=Microcystis aeruginosa NIES-2549 TaxID=1641812 RepID=A0A0F6RKI5_MICAE|nr:hypothetical protein MYAER_1165 [Microcystis aeruginosa NIES-2549]AOC51919.1 hypothetical protein amyaer_1182 [Microcystis aeruginosa NIES-2481]
MFLQISDAPIWHHLQRTATVPTFPKTRDFLPNHQDNRYSYSN